VLRSFIRERTPIRSDVRARLGDGCRGIVSESTRNRINFFSSRPALAARSLQSIEWCQHNISGRAVGWPEMFVSCKCAGYALVCRHTCQTGRAAGRRVHLTLAIQIGGSTHPGGVGAPRASARASVRNQLGSKAEVAHKAPVFASVGAGLQIEQRRVGAGAQRSSSSVVPDAAKWVLAAAAKDHRRRPSQLDQSCGLAVPLCAPAAAGPHLGPRECSFRRPAISAHQLDVLLG
jgi:hypothetical protein